MENQFWDQHYSKFKLDEPSKFALDSIKYLKDTDTLIELGCGNGRDGRLLKEYVNTYIGYDACSVAVSKFQSILASGLNYDQNKHHVVVGDFTKLDFASLGDRQSRLIIYSRFSLHSINYKDAENLFSSLIKVKTPWLFLLEARTIFDPLYGEGEKVGEHEFRTDHYRRFIDPDKFLSEMSSRFHVLYNEVSEDFAPFRDQNPKVLRMRFEQQKLLK